MIGGHFNTPLSIIDRKTRQMTDKETEGLTLHKLTQQTSVEHCTRQQQNMRASREHMG